MKTSRDALNRSIFLSFLGPALSLNRGPADYELSAGRNGQTRADVPGQCVSVFVRLRSASSVRIYSFGGQLGGQLLVPRVTVRQLTLAPASHEVVASPKLLAARGDVGNVTQPGSALGRAVGEHWRDATGALGCPILNCRPDTAALYCALAGHFLVCLSARDFGTEISGGTFRSSFEGVAPCGSS